MEMLQLQLQQVSNSSWAIVDGSTYGNVGCIRIPHHIVVIDTGMTPVIAKNFRHHIENQIGAPVTEVILTHHHSDHVFGAQEFSQCPIIASSAMMDLYPELLEMQWSPQGIEEMRTFYAKTEPEFSRQLENLQITPPTQTFKQSLYLGENQEVEVRHTGGHTAGHSIVYFKPERVLFAGDLVFCREYPYAGDSSNNPPQWMEAFEMILEMPVVTIVPGHGPLCDKDEIRVQLDYFRELERWIQEKIQQGLSVNSVQHMKKDRPRPPYNLKADRRLNATIERWFEFYSATREPRYHSR
jgi:cyclase